MTEAPFLANVLVVDDTVHNISVLSAALGGTYTIRVATSGQQAINTCRILPVDIILLDVMMPEMDGFETCRRLKANPLTSAIPVIFVTAKDGMQDEAMGFACGGVDYITKPIKAEIVRARVKTHLALYNQNCVLEQMVRERTAELQETRLEIIHRLGSAGEYRDNETGLHVIRVCHYCRLLGQNLGLPEREADLLFNVAGLHDVGKIGIPDGILLKPGKLDAGEYQIIQSHCEIGARIIGAHPHSLLKMAATVALTHHERWDGTGYPQGLKEDDIPLFGRMVAVADVFDALTSVRPYKRAWPVAEAIDEIRRCRGQQFDPQVVDAFLCVIPEVIAVQQQFGDTVGDLAK